MQGVEHQEKPVTVPQLIERKRKIREGTAKPISALTAYDYTSARLLDRAGVDIILVGDTLGVIVQGHTTTLSVTLDEVIYHTKCVRRAVRRALLVADLPFMSYQVSVESAIENSGRVMKETGASAVKLEGGESISHIIERLTEIDIPVMGHIGLTPQSYHRMGGHRIQGKQGKRNAPRLVARGSRDQLFADARAVEAAGAFAVVIEGVPREVAAEITDFLSIPTIGIGAGADCDGQILVSPDMLGMIPDFNPKFVKRFGEIGNAIDTAVKKYVEEVGSRTFPGDDNSFSEPPTRKTKGARRGRSNLRRIV